MRRTTARAKEAASGAGDRRPLMSAEELADFLGVPLNTVYIWNHRHQGPRAHKVGRYLRYRWPEVEAWLEAQAVDRTV
ncbi:helix-turn-helix domain-containing protein [Mesorhizobium sp. B2-3-3]|uniref:helix-turn-helix transcriptional regulator n=1 Tax=unclassified Streptomyces TaxID=2593676 RepID=UPI000CD4B76E|nr:MULTISPECIES: helix-turn-helix domain-containing protein [unclassified Streptomyces]TPM90048.1 helix-turn-helix domain-containing protein [Mesorhizobium sp. B2-3-3]